MAEVLLERDAQLGVLVGAVAEGGEGRGSTALVAGEAGIGKTSLVRALVARVGGEARVLVAACDDLVASRTLGPLRDAAAGTRRPARGRAGRGRARRPRLRRAARGARRGAPDGARRRGRPLGRRRHARRPRLRGATRRGRRRRAGPDACATSSIRAIRCTGCSARSAAARSTGSSCRRSRAAPSQALAAGTGRDAAAVHALTGGNPFFVTETLAAPRDEVPASVKDAVLARLRGLDADCREALERLSVVPSHVPPELADACCWARASSALPAAELAGVIEDRPDGLGFRHELARRAIESSLPVTRVRLLNQAVVEALRLQDAPGARRGSCTTRSRPATSTPCSPSGPQAAREAARAGAHRQALAHLEAVVPVRGAAGAGRAGRACSTTTAGSSTTPRASATRCGPGSAAAELYAGLGEPVALGLVPRARLAPLVHGRRDRRGRGVRRARRADPRGGGRRRGARPGHALPGRDPRPGRGPRAAPAPCCAAPASLARRVAAHGPRRAVPELHRHRARGARRPRGLDQVRDEHRRSPPPGATTRTAARGYTNLAELLLRAGRLDELERCVADGLAFTRERGFWSHAYNLEVHRCLLLMRRGDWDGAEQRAAPAHRHGRRPGDALRLQRALARAPARAPRRPGGRGDARRGVGAGAAPPPAARPRLRRDRARRVGVAGRPARGRRAGRGRRCCRAPSIRARRRSAASCCATSRARASRPSRSRAARPAGRRGCGRLARGGRRRGRRPATPTRRRSSSPSPASRARSGGAAHAGGLRAEPAAARVARAPARDGRRCRAGRGR